MSIEIFNISSQATRPLRQLVLRHGQAIETCIWDGDDLKSTKHFGAFLNSKCIGVLSLYNRQTERLAKNNQYQLRGMAVHPDHQHRGIGRTLLAHLENELKSKERATLWCNARTSAIPFYRKMNFEVISEEFLIQGVGLHYILAKTLD